MESIQNILSDTTDGYLRLKIILVIMLMVVLLLRVAIGSRIIGWASHPAALSGPLSDPELFTEQPDRSPRCFPWQTPSILVLFSGPSPAPMVSALPTSVPGSPGLRWHIPTSLQWLALLFELSVSYVDSTPFNYPLWVTKASCSIHNEKKRDMRSWSISDCPLCWGFPLEALRGNSSVSRTAWG